MEEERVKPGPYFWGKRAYLRSVSGEAFKKYRVGWHTATIYHMSCLGLYRDWERFCCLCHALAVLEFGRVR